MVQKQIVEYAKSQLKLGLDAEVIKSALIEAGWSGEDVDDSLKSLNSAAVASPSSFTPASLVGGFSSDVDRKEIAKNEEKETGVRVIREIEVKKEDLPTGLSWWKVNRKKAIMGAAAGIVVAIVAASVVIYLGKRKSEESSASASEIASLTVRVNELDKMKQDLTKQSEDLVAVIKDLKTEVSFIVVPPRTTESATVSEMSFTIKGVLEQNRGRYVLNTENGVKISIVNSADSKVEALLKPLVGNVVEISGTHAAGSSDAKVSAVNGESVSVEN